MELIKYFDAFAGISGFRSAFERISDSQLYKMAWNAVTVNVAEAIAENLLKFNRVK